MINKERLAEIVKQYKEIFTERWNKPQDERYKWVAVKWFQEHWDIDAEDFADMLKKSLSKADNLLGTVSTYPASMICGFANDAPEEVRTMFRNLFDENEDVFDRIQAFKDTSAYLLDCYGKGAKNHFQNENVITTYLWMHDPDTYSIYKYSYVKKLSSYLEYGYSFKTGYYEDNIRQWIILANELRSELKQDEGLRELLDRCLDEECYPDPELMTLITDLTHYVAKAYQKETEEWHGSDYDPGLDVEDWISLLNDSRVFTANCLEIMKRFKDYGGAATCKQLAVRYGGTAAYYNATCIALAKRIIKYAEIEPHRNEDGSIRAFWDVMFVGKLAPADEDGVFIWRLRDELSDALDQVDLSHVSLYVKDEGEQQYWWLNANPKVWSFSSLAEGESEAYTLFNENGNKRRIFQNFLDARAGDMVIGYESNPVKKIVAICRVAEEQDGEVILFEKVEGLNSPIEYAALKVCPELDKMEYFQNAQGSLFKLTPGEYEFILDMIREENPLRESAKIEKYTKEDFLADVYMSEEKYDTLKAVLKNKLNIILQGAPGVGKTYCAKKLAYSIMGEKDDSRIELIQFHQNYTYEDFIMGYKPKENTFVLTDGVFYRFCQKAKNQPDKSFFFIIDEINRGNLSKIFGELMMLIEKEYRDHEITLAYNDMPFSVPKNIYIIGTMNTADRSLAMIDYALRRRFSFFEMSPGFDTKGFLEYQSRLNSPLLDRVIDKIKSLNREIEDDSSLGRGFCIGHSYFCGQKECTEDWLKAVIDYDIIMMLQEYWFDEEAKVSRWKQEFDGIFA